MCDRIDPVWRMFLDQKNGLFVMGKREYDELPAIAADALRLISAEYDRQTKK